MKLYEQPQADAWAALDRVKHLVVLMMENRSFDHMLGYLSLGARDDIDGLREGMDNIHEGRRYGIHHLDRTARERGFGDPHHGGKSVERQIASGTMGGFVHDWLHDSERDATDPRQFPMGYYDGDDLPVYHHLSEHFCVCDAWFSSVPGATFPNRLYAVAGQSGGRKDNKKLLGKLDVPIYDYPAFTRHLDNRRIPWRWYSARPRDIELPTVQCVDGRYRDPRMFGQRFALFDRKEAGGQPSFLDDARDGNLPALAWIDPDFGIMHRGQNNDDHPEADVRRGQALVAAVVDAVMRSSQWPETLLVITYDEHGGFFDHVPPPPVADDVEHMRSYGVRVPALIVSPYVEPRSVGKVVSDHTSIIRTALELFCRDETTNKVPWMGQRVDAAKHLGHLLTLDAPRPAHPALLPDLDLPPYGPGDREEPSMAEHARLIAPRVSDPIGQRLVDEAGGAPLVNDLQLGLMRAAYEQRELAALLAAETDENPQ
jgi:phospholipase C